MVFVLPPAKLISGKQKVDIIAHSMGGIVTRSYIQNTELYENDINKFAMVGTPNQGAPFAYLVWEDGNTITADEFAISQNLDLESAPNSYFYTNSVNNFMKTKWNQEPCSIQRRLLISNVSQTPSNCNNQLIKRFVQEHVPGLRDLLPTYEGAINDLSGNSINYAENTDLINLNNDVSVYNTINVILLAGVNKGTLDSLQITPSGNIVYANIEPGGSNQSGDGTVPRKSILFPDLVNTENTSLDIEMGSHGELPLVFKTLINSYISL